MHAYNWAEVLCLVSVRLGRDVTPRAWQPTHILSGFCPFLISLSLMFSYINSSIISDPKASHKIGLAEVLGTLQR